MARNTGTFAFSANFEPKIALPLDARMLVGVKADLIDPAAMAKGGFDSTYKGMIVSVANDSTPANNGLYLLTDTDYTVAGNWLKIGSNESVATGDTISGDGTSGSPLDVVPGEVDHDSLLNYSIDQHRTINDAGSASTDLWSADKIGTELGDKQDTSEKGQPNGYASLDANGKVPASELTISALEYKGTFNATTGTPALADGTGNTGDLYIVDVAGSYDFGSGSITFAVGDWVLYDGTLWSKVINSNVSYTFSTGLLNSEGTITVVPGEIDHDSLDNYFIDQHRTINDAATGTTDLWSASKINEAIEAVAGDITYTNATETEIAVGGIAIGEVFDAQTITEMFDKLLYPTLVPTLVDPSMVSFTVLADGVAGPLFEIGQVITTLAFTATFSRGSITPAYTTSGFRSGPANAYNYTGTGLAAVSPFASTSNTDNQSVSSYTILQGSNTWTASVSHDIGEQPLNNKGVDYDSPLAAGTVSAITRTITGTYPFFANTVAIGTQTKMALQALSTTTVTVSFVGEDATFKQKLEVPEAFFAALTQVEQYNPYAQEPWQVVQDGVATFTKSTVYTIDVQGNSVNYYSFTHNGALVDARQVRFTFSKS